MDERQRLAPFCICEIQIMQILLPPHFALAKSAKWACQYTRTDTTCHIWCGKCPGQETSFHRQAGCFEPFDSVGCQPKQFFCFAHLFMFVNIRISKLLTVEIAYKWHTQSFCGCGSLFARGFLLPIVSIKLLKSATSASWTWRFGERQRDWDLGDPRWGGTVAVSRDNDTLLKLMAWRFMPLESASNNLKMLQLHGANT